MRNLHQIGRYVNFLVVAAVLLPLIFIAGVVYVERQQADSMVRVRAEELARLRAVAATAWLSNQAAYIRGISKLPAVTAGTPNAADELASFITAETGLLALGYAESGGTVQVDTGGRTGRDIAGSNYFIEAAAGREYQGEVPGTDWLQNGNVTIVAAPVTVNGEVTGIVYGVIRQETIAARAAGLVPDIPGGKAPLSRWFFWLGSLYLIGVIPLLLLGWFLRRWQARAAAFPEDAIERQVFESGREQTVGMQSPEEAAAEEFETTQNELIAILQQELALASKRSAKDTASESAAGSKPAAVTAADITPAAVIDRALAAKAYKPKTFGQQAPAVTTLPDNKPAVTPVSQPLHRLQPLIGKKNTPRLPAVDSLTGLYSRQEFEKIIAARTGQPDSIMLALSINGMKVINDFLGRAAGDAIITATADIVKTVAGAECMAARFDGDKFIVLLPAASPDMAEDIKKDVKYHVDLHNLRNPEVPLSITLGAAAADADGDLRNVWERAERDMESHKAVNRVEARRFIMWSMKRNRGRS
ncbi:diguanylate cyclase domain-containing protein [Sporomusa sphaeroides]|uniref:Diguanylate cyclase AdrA n=1 Tax=Sporomusa sphaeroides DSM 2875 TaxID=1337886 RepID=A0ABM9W0E3_9FIRM|nr:diguanylate cyclase [Sporomusa sphaeroides]OLS56694.1 putative diguanylate cyclase AdrA [Sporomusa sphaeroides DSM 2875]CVK18641.1 putative diguanylate cyclase AdrA [Sporomusa sphaeroides DSM 2875]